MAFLWRLMGYPPPPTAITDQQIDLLLEVPQLYYPPVQFSPLVKAELKKYVKANWAARPGQKTPTQLMSELLHDCTQEYLTGLTYPPIPAIPSLNEDIAQKKAEMDSARSKEDKALWANLIEIKIDEISKLFTEGYSEVFRGNLLFDSEGRPAGVREAGGDRADRFPLCHRRLADDDALRRGPRSDPEANPFRALRRTATSSSERRRRISSERRKRGTLRRSSSK